MNLLDKAIAAISPEAGLRRLRARAASSHIEQFAYEGAKRGRRSEGWFRPSTDANSENISLARLRDGGRDLVRNNPLGAKAVREIATKAIGTGIMPRALTDSPAINSILDENFAEWADEMNADGGGYTGMQDTAARSIVEGGEAVLRFRPRRLEDGLTIPLQVQLLEPDFIDHTKTMPLQGGYIIQGVEFDLLGREVACWMFPSHPGAAINTQALAQPLFTPYRVPTKTGNPLEGIERGFRKDRAGQVRGISWFAPAMLAMWDLNGYENAEQVRKRMEACLAGFWTGPEADGANPKLGTQTTDDDGRVIEEFRPGMFTRVPFGSTVTIAEPKSSGGYAEYMRTRQRVIAAAIGLPYELLVGDFSVTNYSSSRLGLIDFKDLIEVFQWNVLVPFICTPVWRRFVDACKITGIVPANTSYAVEWGPPKFDLLDRLAEAEADEKEIRLGTMTWPQAVQRQGLDARKQLKQIAESNSEFDKVGVVLDCDPRRIGRAGQAQRDPAQTDLPIPAKGN
jgi:lambda family phage portal protein